MLYNNLGSESELEPSDVRELNSHVMGSLARRARILCPETPVDGTGEDAINLRGLKCFGNRADAKGGGRLPRTIALVRPSHEKFLPSGTGMLIS